MRWKAANELRSEDHQREVVEDRAQGTAGETTKCRGPRNNTSSAARARSPEARRRSQRGTVRTEPKQRAIEVEELLCGATNCGPARVEGLRP